MTCQCIMQANAPPDPAVLGQGFEALLSACCRQCPTAQSRTLTLPAARNQGLGFRGWGSKASHDMRLSAYCSAPLRAVRLLATDTMDAVEHHLAPFAASAHGVATRQGPASQLMARGTAAHRGMHLDSIS